MAVIACKEVHDDTDQSNKTSAKFGADASLVIVDNGESLRAKLGMIRQAMIGRLPSYMDPSAFIPVGCIARLVSGKLDRRRRGPCSAREPDGRARVRSQGLVERVG